MTTSSQIRRRFRFGLRSLLIAVTVLGVALGLFARSYSEGLRHQRLGRALIAARIDVGFSHYRRGTVQTRAVIESTLPLWIEDWGLAPTFRRVQWIGIWPRENLPETLKLIQEMGYVDTLSIHDPSITQEQIAETLGRTRVRQLSIHELPLPRTGIPWLKHQHGMTWLGVSRTQFSNAAIEDLPQSLEYFDATRTRINDEGLPKFSRLKNLTKLNLSRTPTTKAAIETLRRQMPWCEITWEELKRP